MRVAVAIHGNLRTFLMPLRNNAGVRICDLIKHHIVSPNNADVFALTDTNDYFREGIQYFPDTRRVEIVNGDAFRIYDRVAFIGHDEAKKVIETEVSSIFGENLKNLVIEPPVNTLDDPKTKILSECKGSGCAPAMMVGQYRKVKLCHDLVAAYETQTSPYDIVIKCRFDLYAPWAFAAGNYDFNNVDVYVPGVKGPVVYDWYAIGTRRAMALYMTLYERLGFPAAAGQMYMCECSRCGLCIRFGIGESKDVIGSPHCPNCGKNDSLWHGDITLAPEHHLFRTFNDNGIRYAPAGYGGHVYRYKEPSGQTLHDATKGMGTMTIVTHTTSKDLDEHVYNKET